MVNARWMRLACMSADGAPRPGPVGTHPSGAFHQACAQSVSWATMPIIGTGSTPPAGVKQGRRMRSLW